MPDPDPCQLFVDAVEESVVQCASLFDQYDAALTLLDERLAALDQCREENSVDPLMATQQRKKIAAKREKIKQLKAELQKQDWCVENEKELVKNKWVNAMGSKGGEQKSTTPHFPDPPPIAAEPKSMVEPVMVRTVQDTVQPTGQKVTADIDARILKTAGQRHINLMWETVQAIIALTVTGTGMYVTSVLALREETGAGAGQEAKAAAVAALVFITGVANLIVGFYFGRVNHANVGGVGSKEEHETRWSATMTTTPQRSGATSQSLSRFSVACRFSNGERNHSNSEEVFRLTTKQSNETWVRAELTTWQSR